MRYGFQDIEKRYPGAMLDTFFLKDAVELLDVLLEYENCITWDTSCKNCAKLIDKNYEQYVELEELRHYKLKAEPEIIYWQNKLASAEWHISELKKMLPVQGTIKRLERENI